jgi:hypothetical protein
LVSRHPAAKTVYDWGLTPKQEPTMKTIAAVLLVGAFLLSPPAFAKKKAKADKADTAEKKDDAAKEAPAPKADEPKKDDKKAEKGGW